MTARYQRAPHALSSDLGGETALLDMDSGVYWAIEGSGTLIWDQLEEPRSHDELLQAVCDEFDVDAKRARDDVVAFVAALVDAGLVVRV